MRKSTVVSIVVSLASTLCTVHFWSGRNAERARADGLQADLNRLESTTKTSAASPSTSAEQRYSSTFGDPALAESVAASPIRDAEGHATEDVEQEVALFRNPNYEAAWRANRRLELASRVDEIARFMGLTDELADKLLDLMVDRDFENESSGRVPPASADGKRAWQDRREAVARSFEQRQRELLGDAGFERLTTFYESAVSRGQVRELAAKLAATGEPLRTEQRDQLLRALSAERARMDARLLDFVQEQSARDTSAEAMREYQARVDELQDTGHRRLREAARTVLSAKQLAEFDAMLALERNLDRARDAVWISHTQALEQDSIASQRSKRP
jgi:hypothetical protein